MKATEDRLAVARAVGRECLAKWRVDTDGWQPVDMKVLIESLPEPEPLPEPDVQGADKLGGNSDVQAREGCEMDGCQCVQCVKVRREGVIEGLELALALCPRPNSTTQWYPQDAIRAELERLRAES